MKIAKIFVILLLLISLGIVLFWPQKTARNALSKTKESKKMPSLGKPKEAAPQKSLMDESFKGFTKTKSEAVMLCEKRYAKETLENLDVDSKSYSINAQGFLEYLHPEGIIFVLIPKTHGMVNAFWMSKYEITQGQWQKILGKNPSQNQANVDFPVESISWKDLQEFCQKAGFRIPSSLEWEHACLGHSKDKFPWGNDKERLSEYAWFDKNSQENLQKVGGKLPNSFGLHDMLGNVCEWCEENGSVPNTKIFRGGAYKQASLYCNPQYPREALETTRISYIGARVAMDLGKREIVSKTMTLAEQSVPAKTETSVEKNSAPKAILPQSATTLQQDQGTVLIEPSHWNMGNIPEENILHTKVTIKNQAPKEVHLLEIRSACGCVVSKPQSNSLAPGQNITLDVSFNPKGRRGYQRQELRILTDHEKNKLLVLLIEGSILLSGTISEKQINLGEFRQGTKVQRTLKIAARESKNLEVQSTLPYFDLTTKKAMVEGFYPAKQKGWEVTISPKENIPFGRHQGFLEISTNSKEKHQIPIFAYVKGPIVVSRNYISLGTISNKRKDISISLEVTSENQKPFVLASVSCDIPFLSIETKSTKDSQYSIILRSQIPTEIKQGEFRGTLKIQTSHELQPIVEIPIQGFFIPSKIE